VFRFPRLSRTKDAEVTIVGGGAIGCAVAYHLARAGYRDVQLVEAGQLAGATSGQAAGLVGQVRTSVERTRLAMASVRLFSRFEQETGWPVDWRQTGSLRIATTDARVEEFRLMAAVATEAGLDVEFLERRALTERFPPMDTRAVKAALWCPTDGYVQPNSLTTAYAAAARELGVVVATNTRVLDVLVRDAAVVGLETERGRIATETVINAAGPWAWHIAAMVGLDLPIVPVRHEYFVTGPAAGWQPDWPALRIPDARIYVRPEMTAILCGGWEPKALSVDPHESPDAIDTLPAPDWDVLTSFATALDELVPGTTDLGIRDTFRGWPSFTPDGRFVIGPVAGLRGFVMAAGCNAHGVSGSAGLAEHVVESLEPDSSPYVRSLSPSRFMDATWSWSDARQGAQRVYETYYALARSASSRR
jgi:glycine/D-amino acid oxidase-like deaminating enzyme